MEVRAQHRHARMSARKIRTLRGVVRGLPVSEAQAQLAFMPGKAAQIVQQVLKSAVANAIHNYSADEQQLKVTDIVVDEGFTMKRFRPRSRGMAHPIRKPTAHVTVIVEETAATDSKPKKRTVKKTEIEDITAADFIKQAPPAAEVTTPEDDAEPAEAEGKKPAPSKQEESYQVNKMNQQGGDKHKTHRRKSM